MHIRKLTLENIRCFRQLSLDFTRNGALRPWTILVGANGTGKSTLLRTTAASFATDRRRGAFQLLARSDMRRGSDQGSFGAELMSGSEVFNAIQTLQRDDTSLMLWSGEKEPGGLAVGLGPVRLGGQAPPSEGLEQPGEASDLAHRGSLASLYGWPVDRLADLYRRIRWEEFVRLKSIHARAHRPSVLGHLASALDTLFDDLARFREVDTRGQILFDTPDGPVPLEGLADGLRSVFVIVAELMLRLDAAFPDSMLPTHEEAICLVDEIDAHLHPRLQRTIVPALRQLFPNVQFIVTTHSPYVVGSARHGEIVALRREGGAVVAVTDLPDVAGWPADRIATSEIFGLDTTRDLRGEAALKTERDLSGGALTKHDAAALAKAKALLDRADGPLTAMVRDLLTAPRSKPKTSAKKRPVSKVSKVSASSKKRAAG
jgi:energy-coupling factor transporter ATP-binding protein EcfA2